MPQRQRANIAARIDRRLIQQFAQSHADGPATIHHCDDLRDDLCGGGAQRPAMRFLYINEIGPCVHCLSGFVGAPHTHQ